MQPIHATPLARKDAFFGLHFDLHPNKNDTCLGADVSPENIVRLLKRVRPDYVQYDCKGHGGYTGCPTKYGWASNGIIQDSLDLWQRTARPLGVPLFIHYSGVWDKVAVEHHPEWARVDSHGETDPNHTSTFGPYVDELMIPQLKEITSRYDLAGVWADGECWAAQLDYSPAALQAWQKETGYADAPMDSTDPRWSDWKSFHRRQFERYVCHWVDALHEFNPRLQLTSNWMYTSFAPKPIEAKLDFLSGDYTPLLSVDRARVEARYLASTGMPWDLMAWGFNSGEGLGPSLKTALHLQQEAAQVLMQGGGFQIYYNPTRSGLIYNEIIDTAGDVADFCRERQAFSHRSVTVPQVALLLSAESQRDKSDDVFTPYGTTDELEGTLHALLELHYSVDILAEHQLHDRLDHFPLLVIPNSHKLADEFKDRVIRYVRDGGSLLLLGPRCAALFSDLLGARLQGEPQPAEAELDTPAGLVNARGEWQSVEMTEAEAAGLRYQKRGLREDGEVSATIAGFGRGKVCAVYGPVALNYFRSHHPWLRRFIGSLVARIFESPAVMVEAPPCVDVSLRRTHEGHLSVHLANLAGVPLSGRHTVTDYIPPLGRLSVSLKCESEPASVTWQPEGSNLAWEWKEGTLTVHIDTLHIHGVVLIESGFSA